MREEHVEPPLGSATEAPTGGRKRAFTPTRNAFISPLVSCLVACLVLVSLIAAAAGAQDENTRGAPQNTQAQTPRVLPSRPSVSAPLPPRRPPSQQPLQPPAPPPVGAGPFGAPPAAGARPEPLSPDTSVPPPTLPRASRQRMHACAVDWQKIKQEGQTGGTSWREFATKCLTR